MTFQYSKGTFERDITVALSPLMSPEERGIVAADFARVKLGEAQQINRAAMGTVPPHETFVDGKKDAPLESVKDTIVFQFQPMDNAIAWVKEQLDRRAPVLTGRFKHSFIELADGAEVPMGTEVKGAQRYVIVNTQPYSRKIEKGQSRQAPNGLFQAVASIANAKFGKTVRVKFTYMSLTTQVDQSLRGSARRKADRAARQPAIIITPN